MISRNDGSIHVLMISPQFYPLIGGYERAAERLSGALADAGLRVVVIAERRQRAWEKIERRDGYEVQRLFCVHKRRLHAITSLLSFAVFLVRYGLDFDVWHVHQYGYHAALVVALGKLLRRPVVLKLTSSSAMGIKKVMGSGLIGSILKCIHRRVSACVATSEETREEAIRFGIPPDRIHLIPNGVDGRRFRPASPEERAVARRALGLACDRLVLYVGRLSSEKNPLGLLDAWGSVSTRVRDGALLALVGDGPEGDRVHARAQTSTFASSLHLAGSRSDVSIWYRAADLYVLPSILEGLSNTMIEALASGVPVISTRVSGSSILVEPPAAGVVVDVGDIEKLAGAMESLLRDASLRGQLGVEARRKFDAHFSLETLSRTTGLLYKSLLDQVKNRRKA